jgi:serine/threonine protein kinase
MSLQAAQLTVKPATRPVRTFNRYQVLGELGRGGMGVVYRARDRKLSRLVALKVLPREWSRNDIARRRFIREAHAASAIDHQNICTIYDIDSTATGHLFLVMACYDGETLKDRLSRGRLTTAEIVDIASQVSSALGAAHACGIVHGDIKPGNIFLCRSGLVKVLDFGLARRFRQGGVGDGDRLETPGRPFGTANYMAPERILDKPVDPRSDIFSLGVVIYEMATGLRPFAGDSPAETVMNVLDRKPEPIACHAATRPAQLDRIVRKALAKDADDRYQTVAQMEDALRRMKPDRMASHGIDAVAGKRRSA